MRPRIVLTLWRKELLEVVRDRRALFLMLLLPLLLYPLIFLIASQVAIEQTKKVRATVPVVGVGPAPVPDALVERLEQDGKLRVERGELAALKESLAQQKVHAVVALPDGFAGTLLGQDTAAVTVLFDQTSDVSSHADELVSTALRDFAKAVTQDRLDRHGLPATIARPLQVTSQNIAPPEKVGGHLLGSALPMLVIVMLVLGAFYPAIEVTAGEKERGTLVTLLTAPVRALEIVAGKYLSVLTVALVTGAANVASIGLLLGMAVVLPDDLRGKIDLGLSGLTLFRAGYVAVLAAVFYAALMMTVAVLARTYKEAQSFMTPVYLLSVLPSFFAQLPGAKLDGTLSFVPGVNLALLLRHVFEGTATAQQAFTVTLATLVATTLVLLLAARIFQRESILLGQGGILAALASPSGRVEPVPTPGQALGTMAVVFVLIFYIGSVVQARWLLPGLAITQWLLILLPVLAWLRWQRMDVSRALGLTRAPWTALGSALLLGASAWYPVLYGASRFLADPTAKPPPSDGPATDPIQEVFQRLLSDEVSPVLLLLVVAISPAICEEVLFRGLLLRAFLRSMRPRVAVLVTALLFGAFHLSLARIVPTAALGVLLGLLAVRSGSLWPGVVFHALHNGLSLLIARSGRDVPGITTDGAPAPWQLGLIVLMLLGGTLLLGLSRPTASLPLPTTGTRP